MSSAEGRPAAPGRPAALRTDVVVAGAGMAGVLTALALAGRGLDVLLVEQHRLGGGQSGQSHGYLHQGYAYGPDEPQLPALFRRARAHWGELTAGLTPETPGATVAFSNEAARLRAERYWQASGLPVRPVRAPGWLGPGFTSCFRSDELTYNFGHILRCLGRSTAAAGVESVPGRIAAVTEEAAGVRAELVRPDGTAVTVHGRAVVVAAGAGSPALLARSGLPPVVYCRKSFMLVLRGALPVVGAVFPEREEHGLFLASRTGHPAGTTWLVSDFQSFDGGHGDPRQLAGWWAHRLLTTLRRVVDAPVLAEVRAVSGYAAVKSGLLPSSGTVAHEFSRDFLGGRVVVTSPSKLTLAPLAAESAVRSVCARLGLPFHGLTWDGVDRQPPGPGALPGPAGEACEAWETGLAAVEHPGLPDALPDIPTLSSLYAR
ncbi:hypothetical protein KNE206_58880 [Kitasatospora sp. NE20-6]|uniref:NAD(P)/FAD-dependent oxidoreductase n=1 Tax=Kitasatospora sp. NE20-6 TaxID=2859066 RepID=UPI0034DBF658